MNTTIFYLSLILIVGFFFIRCSKSNKISEPEPDPPPKDNKYKVIEYHTNEPIYNALLEITTCTRTTGYNWGGANCINTRTVGSWYSDMNGEILIPSHWRLAIGGGIFSKENYWTKSYVDSIITGQKLDSAVVRLFPYSWLKIHIKTGTPPNGSRNIFMNFDIVSDSVRADIHPGYSHFSFTPVNLDTTVICTTFGNIKNIVTAGFDNLSGQRLLLYSKTQFVKKNDTVNVEIIL